MADNADVISALTHLERKAQNSVTVSALHGGWLTLPKKLFLAGVPDDEKRLVPSLSFLLQHTQPGAASELLVFDLGLRRDLTQYSPKIQDHLKTRQPLKLLPDVRQSLIRSGVSTDAISHVILSHVHWDHIGTPTDFPAAEFHVGAGSLSLLEGMAISHMSHSNFQADLFDNLSVKEFPAPTGGTSSGGWERLGGLDVLDFFGDGSVYVVDSPGHLQGHSSLLSRVSPKNWVLLVGDACHDSRLLTGERDIAEWEDAEGRICCIHADKEVSARILHTFSQWSDAAAEINFQLRIIFAHDADWAEANPDAFAPGSL